MEKFLGVSLHARLASKLFLSDLSIPLAIINHVYKFTMGKAMAEKQISTKGIDCNSLKRIDLFRQCRTIL